MGYIGEKEYGIAEESRSTEMPKSGRDDWSADGQHDTGDRATSTLHQHQRKKERECADVPIQKTCRYSHTKKSI